MRAPDTPVALTIAGSDSGGEAGLQADLKTFAALKVHGACVITCVTAQNRQSVARLEPCSTRMVRAQLEAVAAACPPSAAKTENAPIIGESVIHDLQELKHRREQEVAFLLAKLMLETGEKKKDKEAKATTAQRLWIPAVNNHGEFGRWAFREIRDPWDAKHEIRSALTGKRFKLSPSC